VTDRLDRELDLIRGKHGEIIVAADRSWVQLPDCPLVPGWNQPSTAVLVEVPPAYPTTPPDNFYTVADLRLADGQLPGNTTGVRVFDGAPWLQFSYHVETTDWRPHADPALSENLVTYFDGALQRLREPN